jgi:hypothetical protein
MSEADQKMAAHWKTQIEQCDKSTHNWHKRGDKILRNYRDERDEKDAGVAKRLNLFWSNTQVKNPSIYSKAPVPICERRFLDKDPTGRVASTILERALRYELPTSGFHATLKRCRTDRGTIGRGQAWVRYNPKFGEAISPEQTANNDIEIDGKIAGEEESEEAKQREFLSESLCVDYVHWKDYYTFPASARIEPEIEGKGRRLYMGREDLIRYFGEKIGKKIELDYKPKTDGNQGGESTLSGQEGMQATIYEIWWKPTRKVYFIAKSYDDICKEADDPLKLDGFFPCPEPWSATMTNDTLLPVPDYAESQDQYIQIDDLTKRIDILTASCKVIGVYDAAAQSLKRVFQEAQEPNLIPVDSWAMFAEKGGLKGAIDWVPIENIANALKILIEVRKQIVEDLDRTTGINDLMRGTSDARETMGAQRLKSNGSNTRIQDEQDEAARFCRDIICIMGEIISEHYDPKTLIQVSGAMFDEGLDPPPLPPQPTMMGHNGGPPMAPQMPGEQPPTQPGPPQAGIAPPAQPAEESPEQKQQRKDEMIANAIMLLRNDKLRGFRIDIETDSTVQGDAQEEKQSRIEFIEGMTKFIEMAAQVSAQLPAFAPLAGKMLQFGVRGFRVGRDLETAIEEFCEKAEQAAKDNAANPKPDPEQIKQETEKIKQQGEIQSQQVEAQSEQTNAQIRLKEAEMKQQGDQQRLALDAQKDQAQFNLEMKKLQMQNEYEREAHARKMEELAAQAKMKEHERSERKKEMNGASHD